MGINSEVVARIYLPAIILTSLILFLFYAVAMIVYKAYVYDILNGIKDDGVKQYRNQSDRVAEYMTKSLEITSLHVVLAQNLVNRYVEDNSIMKSDFTTDLLINAYEYEANLSMEGSNTKCKESFTCSEWYIDDNIMKIEDLDDISKRFLDYSNLIQTVYKQPISSTDKVMSSIFQDTHTGYTTGLTLLYPTMKTTLFTDYNCNGLSDTCRYIPCNKFQLHCRYWYSQTQQLASRVYKDDSLLLKPYNRYVGDDRVLLQNSCIRLYEANKVIGISCIGIRPDNQLISSIQSACKLNGQDMIPFITDTDGSIFYHPDIIDIKDPDLIVKSAPDIIFKTDSKEKQEFSEKYYRHLEEIQRQDSKEQQESSEKHYRQLDEVQTQDTSEFFFMMDEIEYFMRLINTKNSRGISIGVMGFYLAYGVIEKQTNIIEQDVDGTVEFGFCISMAIILILMACFGTFAYSAIVLFTYSVNECAEELKLIKEGKLKYEAKAYIYNKEINHLHKNFTRFTIIYALNNENNLTDLDTCIQIYKDAYMMFTEIENYKGIYAVGYNLGLLYMQKSYYKQAIEVFEICIRIARSNKTDGESLGRVLSCLLQAYYMVDKSDSMILLFRNFEDVLYEKDIKTQLLLECDYIQYNNLPLRNYIQAVKEKIDRDKDHILLQKYYYYKSLMYYHDRNYAQAIKAIEKSLKAGSIFDPQLRKLVLKKLQEILSEFDASSGWVESYITSLKDAPVDIVILSAICPDKAEFYFDLMRRINQYRSEDDSITHFICNSEETLLDKDPLQHSVGKFQDSDKSYFHEGFQTAISLMREKREERGRSNLWIVILNDKEFNMNPTAINNLQTVSEELCINYSVITTRSSIAFEKITEKSARAIHYEILDTEHIERMVKFIFCMRYEISTFISERFLYATYLI